MFESKAVNLPSSDLAFQNCIFVPEPLFKQLAQNSHSNPVLVQIKDYVLTVKPHKSIQQGVGMGKNIRQMARISLVQSQTVSIFKPPNDFFIGSSSLDVQILGRRNSKLQIQQQELEKHLIQNFNNFVLNMNQKLLVDYQGVPLGMTVTNLSLINLQLPGPEDQQRPCLRGFINSQTSFSFNSISHQILDIVSSKIKAVSLFDGPKFNFVDLGIGGLDQQFQLIFRRAFASRMFPASAVKKLNIKHVKGMLLYGPPGTGKTLIARQLAKCLKAKPPKTVNGPQIFDKFVGGTQQKIRELFVQAERQQDAKGDKSELHIIIFDEIDAICKQRGTIQGSTGVHDTAVNQLLSKIDGVNALNNILIIGMTNRKDMIDQAVLRPGRLELHVQIGLPDQAGRQQILNIHTSHLKANGALAFDVDIPRLAALTMNYTGAQIQGLVKDAASYAFNREIDPQNLGRVINFDQMQVTMNDFTQSLSEIVPQFGADTDDLQRYIPQDLIDYGGNYKNALNTCRDLVNLVKSSNSTPLYSVLLQGPPETGKTTLAAQLAVECEFPFVKVISPENYVGFHQGGKLSAIAKIFEDAYRSPLSMVVLDNIERLIDFVNSGPRFSNSILQAILVLTKKHPHKNRKIFIIGTTSNADLLVNLDLIRGFNELIEVPELSSAREIQKVLKHYKIQRGVRKDIASRMRPIPIKKLVLAIQRAMEYGPIVNAQNFMPFVNSSRY